MKWKSWGLRLLIIIALLAIVNEFRPKQVFRDLTQDDVVSADVLFGAYPPYPMTAEDQRKLVLCLQIATVTRRAPEHTEYAGGTVFPGFKLNLADGSTIRVFERNPFFIINGTGYRFHYVPLDDIDELFYPYIETIRSTTEPITNK